MPRVWCGIVLLHTLYFVLVGRKQCPEVEALCPNQTSSQGEMAVS